MVKLTVDHETLAKLLDLNERLELCDESGRLLGYFNPVVDPSMYEGLDSQVSAEELERRSREGGGRPLADILADLEKRA
ncbi:MAG: hypothetical protein H8E37_09165 [Planctomycetes bacterium]|nr:hypothetical protein [Planctomycetota bacterium]